MTTRVETVAAGRKRVADERMRAEVRRGGMMARNLLLFMAAPWIGLAYIIAFPFVGTAVLLKTVLQG